MLQISPETTLSEAIGQFTSPYDTENARTYHRIHKIQETQTSRALNKKNRVQATKSGEETSKDWGPLAAEAQHGLQCTSGQSVAVAYRRLPV